MKLIIVLLKGGLGNQMFQYAYGYALSNKLKVKLGFNTQWFDTYGKGHSELRLTEFQLLKYPPYEPYIKTDGIILDGYFQIPMAFNEYREELKSIFVHIHDYLPENSIAMHIRRNDYVGLGRSFNEEYYHGLTERFRNPIIFSDDPEWAKQFGQVYESRGVVSDMLTMSTAKTIVIGNSTYSWWAAYLSDSNDIWYPKEILTHCNPRIVEGLEWNQI